MGPFSGIARNSLLEAWQKELRGQFSVEYSDNYQLDELAVTIPVIRKWNVCGLPSNPVSVCNGIFVKRSESYPYMIDP